MQDRYAMPMTEETGSAAAGAAQNASQISQDDNLAAAVSSYLDGELQGSDLEAFEQLLRGNEQLAREVGELRRLDRQLSKLGADILDEPLPDEWLKKLSTAARR
jgi:anti-sigma factor RsiW